MKILNGSHLLKAKPGLPVLTIGHFDGVHLGHRVILKKVVSKADKIGGTSIVYTFEPHPVKIIAPASCPTLLQTREQKISAIKECGIDICIIEPFTHKFSQLSPGEFFKKVILKKIKPVCMIIGYDLTFGRHRTGTIEQMEELCKLNKIEIEIVNTIFAKETLVSSTRVRSLIANGDIEIANKMLGRPYAVTGKVIKGRGIGSEIGFHTANIEPENKLIPKQGVYITRTFGRPSVTNIGFNPTFGGSALGIETHILNFKSPIYGKKIEVLFYKRLRDEIMFDSPKSLQKQIEVDIKITKKYFKDHEK